MERQKVENAMVQGKKAGKGISGSTLKIIAIVIMMFDHTAASLIEGGILTPGGKFSYLMLVQPGQAGYVPWLWVDFAIRLIGRIAFPIFCFLLVEGFLHTRNVKKYAFRMFLFALISEVPFDMALFHAPIEFSHQNVFFTLLIGLGTIYFIRRFEGEGPKGETLQVAATVAGCILAFLLNTDYDGFGVILVVAFYLLRNKPAWRAAIGTITLIAVDTFEVAAALAFIPIRLYNGERGLRLKYVFYAFYPVHLLILGLIVM
jgi:hypothetical protein